MAKKDIAAPADEQVRIHESAKETATKPARVWGEYSPKQNLEYLLDKAEEYQPEQLPQIAEDINVSDYPLKAIYQEGDQGGHKLGFYQELVTPERRWNPRLNYESDSPGGYQYGLVFKSGDYRPLTKEQFEFHQKQFQPYKEAGQPYYIHVDPQDATYNRVRLEKGIDNKNKTAKVEVERDEVVLRQNNDGSYSITHDFKFANSHKDGGHPYTLKKGDIVVPADKRERVFDFMDDQDWDAITGLRDELPNELPKSSKLQEGLDTEDEKPKPFTLQQTSGIGSFIKDATEAQGATYTPEIKDELLTQYNYDYDRLIDDIGASYGVSPEKAEMYRSDMYQKYGLAKPDEANIAEISFLKQQPGAGAEGYDRYSKLHEERQLAEGLLRNISTQRTPEEQQEALYGKVIPAGLPDASQFTEDLQLTPEARAEKSRRENLNLREKDILGRIDQINEEIAKQAEVNREQFGYISAQHEAAQKQYEQYDSLLADAIKKKEERSTIDLNKNTPVSAGVYYYPTKEYQKEDVEKVNDLRNIKELYGDITKLEGAPKGEDFAAQMDGLLYGFKNNFFTNDFVTLGLNEFNRLTNVKDAFDNYNEVKQRLIDEGAYDARDTQGLDEAIRQQLPQEKMALLDTYNAMLQLQAGSEANFGTSVGEGLKEMIPFIVQFAATGGVGQGAKEVVKKFVTSRTKSAIAGRIAGAVARPLAQAAVMFPAELQNYAERVAPTMDEQGNLIEGQQPINAAFKAYLSTVAEVAGEGVGEFTNKWANKAARKYFAGIIANDPTRAQEFLGKLALGLTRETNIPGIQNFVFEWTGEEATGLMQAAIDQDGSFFTPEAQKQLLALTLLASGGFAAGSVPQRIRLKYKFNRANQLLDDVPNDQYATAVRSLAENYTDPTELLDALDDVSSDFQSTEEDYIKARSYISNTIAYNQMNAARAIQLEKNIAQATGSDGQVTLTKFEGENYSVRNPEKLGKPGEIVFLKRPDGTVRPVISQRITQYETKAPDQIVQEQMAAQDEVDLLYEQEQQVQEEAQAKGLEIGRTVETPHGKKTLVSINPDGTSTVEDTKGEQITVNTQEIEPYLTSEQKEQLVEARDTEKEADAAILEGIEQGAEVIADEPLSEGSDIRVIDFSNGQSKIVTPEETIVVNTPEERDSAINQLAQSEIEGAGEVDIDTLPPEEAFRITYAEDPEIAIEILRDQASSVQGQADLSREQSKATNVVSEKKALLTQARELDAQAKLLNDILNDPETFIGQAEEVAQEAIEPAPVGNNIEAKKADIEKRRKDELDKVTTLKRIEREYIQRRNTDEEYNRLTEEADRAETNLERSNILDNRSKRDSQIKKEVRDELKKSKKIITEEKYNAINNKYNAELASLEESNKPTQITFEEPASELTEQEQIFNDADALYNEYLDEQRNSHYEQLEPWQKELLGTRVTRSSFENFADPNNITPAMSRGWFISPDRAGASNEIDVVAQELSEQTGQNVTPQDVVDFIIGNPTNTVRKTTNRQNEIVSEYRRLTGETINRHNALRERLGLEPAPAIELARDVVDDPLAVAEAEQVPFKVQEDIDISDGARKDVAHRTNVIKALNEYQEAFGIPINIISFTELSPEAIEKAKRVGVPDAYYQNGEVYLISESLTSVSKAKKIFLHEAIVHKGLDLVFEQGPVTLLGKKYDTKNQLLDDVYSKLDEESITSRANVYAPGVPIDEFTTAQKRELAEEALATLNETESPRVQVILDKIYNYIRKLLGLTKNQFTKSDLRAMLRDHAELLKQRRDAGEIREDAGRIQETRDVREESAAEGRADIQQPAEAGAEAGDTEDVRFRTIKGSDNLVVLHNLSEDNIRNVDKMGGLPVPSLAIARTDIPFTSYGEISLIADKSMVDPQGYGQARTFNADIYSPRYPSITYDINDRKFDEIFGKANDAIEKYGLNSMSIGSMDLEREGLRRLEDQPASKLAFLMDKGKAPKPKMRDAKVDKSLHKWIKPGWVDSRSLQEDPEFVAAVTKIYQKIDEELGGAAHFVKDGKVNENILRREAGTVANTNAVREPDYSANRDAIREKISKSPSLSKEYSQWIKDKFDSIVKGEKIFKGHTPSGTKRYIPHTLDNVVKELTKGLQGEEGMFYGVGSVRSGAAKEFKSIEEIQQYREDIVSSEAFEEHKEKSRARFDEILELIKPYYKYDTEGWGYQSNAGESLLEYAKKGRSADFKAFPKDVKKEVNDFLDMLKYMPSEYFESKVQRAVGLDEFKAAVVPNNTSQDVIDILEKNGLVIKKYNPKIEGDRVKKTELTARQQDVKFRVETPSTTDEITNPEYWKGKTFGYIHNTEPSPYMGERFGQDVEPSGKYITMGYGFVPANNQEGTVTFNNPLVIDTTGQEYPQWKRDLSLLNDNKTGQELSDELRSQGYDSIITVEEYKGNWYPQETIILDNEIDSNKGSRELNPNQPKFRVADSQQELDDFVKDSKVKETVYHGTGVEFTEFDKEQTGKYHFEAKDGFFFTDRKRSAENYARLTSDDGKGIVMSTKLNIKNPLILNSHDYWEAVEKYDRQSATIIDDAKENGHDGIISKSPSGSLFVAFSPDQILIEPTEDVKFRVEEDLLSRIDKHDLNSFFSENDLSEEEIQDNLTGEDTYWLEEYLNDKYQISITDNGLVQFEELTPEVELIIGNNPVLMYHHTSTGVLDNIKKEGLKETGVDVNRQGEVEKGVYLTTKYSGPEVDGYKYNAVQVHGGDPITLEVKTKIDNLTPDEDDADISAGRNQFTVPNISPDNIVDFGDDVKFRVEQEREKVNTTPTEAQKEAGNYQMGHIKVDGFDITIENPIGSVREGVDKGGQKWSNVMPADYGYIRGTVGKDKDHLDVFMGPNLESNRVFIIDQVNPETGQFDEHKIMMGYNSLSEAKNAYNEAYDEDWKGLGAITSTTKEGLKKWINEGDTKKPYALEELPKFRIAESQQELNDFVKDSKIKDTVYHGTRNIFDKFAQNNEGIHFGTTSQAKMRGGKRIINAKINISKIKKVKDTPGSWEKVIKKAKKDGYDGLYYLNRFEGIPYETFENLRKSGITDSQMDSMPDSKFERLVPEASYSYIVFSPDQILIEPTESVKFRVKSDDPKTQALLDRLEEIRQMAKSTAKIAGLEQDKAKAFELERNYIQDKINEFKEGVKAGKAEQTEIIAEIQKSIADYAKKTLPLTEAGAREISSLLTLVRNAQTPQAIERAFTRIDELAGVTEKRTDLRKYTTKTNRLLKWMTGLKKSGTKRVGKFNYQDTEGFQELGRIDKRVKELVKVTNARNASAGEKMDAEAEIDALWNELNEKPNKTPLDNATLKLIELRRLGAKASPALAKVLSEELETIYKIAKETKNEADLMKALNRTKDKEYVESFLEDAKNLKELPWARRAMTQINTGVADIMGNWETIMTMIGGNKLRDDMTFLLDETQAAVGKQETYDRLLDEAKKLYGKDSKLATTNHIHELSKEQYKLRQPNRRGEAGKGLPMELSKLQLMDIYNAIKNPDVARDYFMSYGDISLNEDGSRDNDAQMVDGELRINKLLDNLSEEDKQFADAMQAELDKYYDKMNEVHIKLYNRDLPRVENYWPSTAERDQDIDIMNQMFIDSRHPGATKERSSHRTPEPRDAFNKFTKHVEDAEWYTNMALNVKRANDLFKDNNIKRQIIDKRGKTFYRNIEQALQNVGLTPPSKMQQDSKLNSLLNPVLNNWVAAKIGATPSVPLKQLLSAVNYAENMPMEKWAANFISTMANPKEAWNEMMKIPYLKTRLGDGYSETVQRALQGDEQVHKSKVKNYHDAFKNLMTIGTRYGDITAIIFGGKPYLDYLIKDKGLSEKEAVDQFLLDTLRSQQSPFSSSLSKLQNSRNVFLRAMFTFANTPSQYMRKLFEANQNYRVEKARYEAGKIDKAEFNKAKKQAAKAHTIYGLINTVTFTMAGELIGALLKGGSIDEEDLYKKMLAQLSGTYVGGLPLIKNMVDEATRQTLGMKVYDSVNPYMEGIGTVTETGIKLAKGDVKDKAKAYERIGSAVADMVGVPYYNLKKTISSLPPFRSETVKETEVKETGDKLSRLAKSDFAPKADAAKNLKQAYSTAKAKATKLRNAGSKAAAKRIDDAIERSKASMADTKYSVNDMKKELELFNRVISRIK